MILTDATEPNVIVYENLKILDEKSEQSSLIKSDSLLSLGKYLYRTYSYKELENKNWKINYPNDGFKKGRAINLK